MRVWLIALVALLLTGCQAEQEFSTWPCRFSYDNSLHLDPALSSAMDAGSRGVFCQISEESRGGVKYLNFATNSGLTSQQRELALELQSSFVLGINNGIIVGYQTFVTEGAYGGFIGYDVQCPNCVRNNNNYINPTYPVRMASSGIATCSKCGRKYDMNNGGIIQNGGEGDTGLEKYVATAPNGPQGYLNVFRR